VTWVLGPIAGNPFGYGNLSLSEKCANPIEYYFYRARYYEPGVGRFTQMDPLPMKDRYLFNLHNYVYANNNPIRYIDPYGLQADEGGLPHSIADCIATLRKQVEAFHPASTAAAIPRIVMPTVAGCGVGAYIGGVVLSIPASVIGCVVGFGAGLAGNWAWSSAEEAAFGNAVMAQFKNCVENSKNCSQCPKCTPEFAEALFKMIYQH
jgi:RHS repeat-associated protein